jgi:type IV pilus assembly protein PilB
VSVVPLVPGAPGEPSGRPRLGDVLLQLGLLDRPQLAGALAARMAEGVSRRLAEVVLDTGLVSDDDLARALAVQHVLPLIDLDLRRVDTAVAWLLPREAAIRSCAVLWESRGDRYGLAIADPADLPAVREALPRDVASSLDVHVATRARIREALDQVWAGTADDAVEPGHAAYVEDATAVHLVDRLVADAVRAGASDLHLEPQRDGVRVRIRVDGVLREVLTLPSTGHGAVVDHLKSLAGLDLDEVHVPQEGRASVGSGDAATDVRISTIPSVHGEKVVVRLLPSRALPSVDDLGFAPSQQRLLLDAASSTRGLVLVTGPAGSGVSSTLLALAAQAVAEGRDVVTIEDPVEVELPGATQVQVDARHGLDACDALRAALRHGPDVVVIPEVHDAGTAGLALEAAADGRLVLLGLRAPDVSAALARLAAMDIAPYAVASSLVLALAQRLVRVPCPDCRAVTEPDPFLLASLWVTDPLGVWVEARGCLTCGGSGYRGRTAVGESLTPSRELHEALDAGGGEAGLRAAVRAAGVRSLRERAVDLARRGGTTLDEIVRAVPDDPEHAF